MIKVEFWVSAANASEHSPVMFDFFEAVNVDPWSCEIARNPLVIQKNSVPSCACNPTAGPISEPTFFSGGNESAVALVHVRPSSGLHIVISKP